MEYEDLRPNITAWILRALFDTRGICEVDVENTSNALRSYLLGTEPADLDDETESDGAISRLRAMRRELGNGPLPLPAGSVLTGNLRALSRYIAGLQDLHIELLALLCCLRKCPPLNDAAHMLGCLDSGKLIAVLSCIVARPREEIAVALGNDGLLASSGLAVVDHDCDFPLPSKIDLLTGLVERALWPVEGSVLTVFEDNFRELKLQSRHGIGDFSYVPIRDELRDHLRDALRSGRPGVNVLLVGEPGVGKTTLVAALAADLGARLLEVVSETTNGRAVEGTRRFASYRAAQRILNAPDVQQPFLVLFDEMDEVQMAFVDDDSDLNLLRHFDRSAGARVGKALFNRVLETNPVPTVWVCNRLKHLDKAFLRRFSFVLEVPKPPTAMREQMLREAVDEFEVPISETLLRKVARMPSVTPALISMNARVTKGIVAARSEADVDSVFESVLTARLKATGVDVAGAPIEPGAGVPYDPLLIHSDVDVVEVVEGLRVNDSARVLLFGAPGTGKSRFAAHVASELGRPMLIKQGSDLLSRYVGDSEKSIAAAFKEAADSGAVLILDEVDSLLGSRTSARQSYEVSFVNQLLQSLESFPGIVFATTNGIDRLDSAAARRFDLKVEFRPLRPEAAAQLLARACETLGIDATGHEQAIRGTSPLTAGDFAAVLRQARFRRVKGIADLVERLRHEVRFKPGANARPIGFVA